MSKENERKIDNCHTAGWEMSLSFSRQVLVDISRRLNRLNELGKNRSCMCSGDLRYSLTIRHDKPWRLRIPFRNYEGYATMQNYWKFIDRQTTKGTMKAARFKAGVKDQVILLHKRKEFKNVSVQNIKSNGTISTGKGSETFEYSLRKRVFTLPVKTSWVSPFVSTTAPSGIIVG